MYDLYVCAVKDLASYGQKMDVLAGHALQGQGGSVSDKTGGTGGGAEKERIPGEMTEKLKKRCQVWSNPVLCVASILCTPVSSAWLRLPDVRVVVV